MGGFNPIQTITNVVDDLGQDLGNVASGIINGLNSVFSPIESTLGNLTTELGNATASLLSNLGSLAGTVITEGTTLVDAIGSAASNLASEAATDLGTIVSDVGHTIGETVSSIEHGIGSTITNELKSVGSSIEDNLTQFVRQYGHVLVDVAANVALPGSSVLIDSAWSTIETGHLPSLSGIEGDAVNALVSEVAPGVDEGVAGLVPDLLNDLTAGSASSAVSQAVDGSLATFASDLASGKSSAQILADLGSSISQSAVASLTGDASGKIDAALIDLLGGTAITSVSQLASSLALSALPDGLEELLITPQALAAMSPTELLALGASQGAAGLISDIGLLPGATAALQFDVSQTLALIGGNIQVLANATLPAQLDDLSSAIDSLTNADLAAMAKDGIDRIVSTDAIAMPLSEAQDLVAHGITIASKLGTAISVTGDQFAGLADGMLADLAKAGFATIDFSEPTNAVASFNQLDALVQDGISLSGAISLDYVANQTDLAALLSGAAAPGTLSLSLLHSFIANGVDTVTFNAALSQLLALSASQISELTQINVNKIVFDVKATPLGLLGAQAQLAGLESSLGTLNWNIAGTIGQIGALTSAQVAGVRNIIGPATIACVDTLANIALLTAKQASALVAAGVLLVQSTTQYPTLNAATARILLNHKIAFSGKLGTPVTLAGTAAVLGNLGTAQLAALPLLNVASIKSTSAQTVETAAWWQAVIALGVAVATPKGGTRTIADTAAAIGGLSVDDIAALARIGVTAISTGSAPVSLSLRQAFALHAGGITLTSGGIAIADTSVNLGTITAAQIANLAGIGVHTITATGGGLTFSVATLDALETAGIRVQSADTTAAIMAVRDDAAGGIQMTLSPGQIGALAKTGISQIILPFGTTMTVAQAEAVLGSGCTVVVSANPPTNLDPSAQYVFAVADSAANLAALTPAQLQALDALGVDGMIVQDTGLTLDVAQIEQVEFLALPQGAGATISDSATHVAGAQVYLNQLLAQGKISALAVSGVSQSAEAPVTFTGTPGGAVTSASGSLPFAAMALTSANATASYTLSVTILNATNQATDQFGTLSGNGLMQTGVGTYTLAAGTVAQLTNELQGLLFDASTGQDSATNFNVRLSASDSQTTSTENLNINVEQPGALIYEHTTTSAGTNATYFQLASGSKNTLSKVAGTTFPQNVVEWNGGVAYLDTKPGAAEGSPFEIYFTNGVNGITMLDPGALNNAINDATFEAVDLVADGKYLIFAGIGADGLDHEWRYDGKTVVAIQDNDLEIGIINPAVTIDGVTYFTSFVTSGSGSTQSATEQLFATTNGFLTNTALTPVGTSLEFGPYFSTNTMFVVDSVESSSGLITADNLDTAVAGGVSLKTIASFASIDGGAAIGSGLVFAATPANGTDGLWFSDGTSAGTTRIALPVGTTGAGNFLSFKNRVLFTATDASGATTAWITDGTTAGTHEISLTVNGTAGPLVDPQFAVWDGQVLLSGFIGDHTYLFISDASAGITNSANGDTQLLLTFSHTNTLTDEIIVQPEMAFGKYAYFNVYDANINFRPGGGPNPGTPEFNFQLWETNGTAAGTFQVGALDTSGTAYPVALNDSGSVVGTSSVTINQTGGEMAINLEAGTSLMLQPVSFVTVTTAGADTVTAAAVGQTILLGTRAAGVGNDTLIGFDGAGDTFAGTLAQWQGETLQNFLSGDLIDITDFSPQTAAAQLVQAFANGFETIQFGSGSSSTDINFTANLATSSFIFASDGHGGTFVALRPGV